jgi:hypothetical protein
MRPTIRRYKSHITRDGRQHTNEQGTWVRTIEFLKDWTPENPLFVPLYEDGGPSTEPSVVAVGSKEDDLYFGGSWRQNVDVRRSGLRSSIPIPFRALAKEAYKMLLEIDVDSHSVKVRTTLGSLSLLLNVRFSGLFPILRMITILSLNLTLLCYPGTTKTSTRTSRYGQKAVRAVPSMATTLHHVQDSIQHACWSMICR